VVLANLMSVVPTGSASGARMLVETPRLMILKVTLGREGLLAFLWPVPEASVGGHGRNGGGVPERDRCVTSASLGWLMTSTTSDNILPLNTRPVGMRLTPLVSRLMEV
jgi:hypothetical protein